MQLIKQKGNENMENLSWFFFFGYGGITSTETNKEEVVSFLTMVSTSEQGGRLLMAREQDCLIGD